MRVLPGSRNSVLTRRVQSAMPALRVICQEAQDKCYCKIKKAFDKVDEVLCSTNDLNYIHDCDKIYDLIASKCPGMLKQELRKFGKDYARSTKERRLCGKLNSTVRKLLKDVEKHDYIPR